MMDEVHKKKRGKNLAVLALVLGWCALIFLITMARLAHADEIPPGGDFLTTRTAHMNRLDDTGKQWIQDWQARDNDRITLENTRNTQRAAHMTNLEQTKTSWTQHWKDGEPTRQSDDATRDTQRAAHTQLLSSRPAGWYAQWDKDYNKYTP